MDISVFVNVKAILAIAAGVFLFSIILTALFLRRVVPTNEVHIVQSAKKTTSYGKDTSNGNTYYEWPSWLPFLGVTKVILPVSVFDLDLSSYEAYDKGRLPFLVDVKAFFRISDSNVAAQRVASFRELQDQLIAVVQGAVRAVLASDEIESIMQGRSHIGDAFTSEVSAQLKAWGVETVKNIELMDLRDARDSQVIHNIMAKKKSFIEMQSRTEVAANMKAAQVAEVEAKREVDIQKQVATQAVGLRTVEAEQTVALAKETQQQTVSDAAKITKMKALAVTEVEKVRAAEIERAAQVVKAEQVKQTSIIAAEQDKQTQVIKAEAAKAAAVLTGEAEKTKTVLVAEGAMQAQKNEAEGLQAVGLAKAEAEKALQMAPVAAQISLAKEIGSNKEYQQYLVTIRQVEAQQAIGVEQAKVLGGADVKIIANTGNGDVSTGLKSVMDLVSSKGGTALSTALMGLAQTEQGQALLEKLGLGTTAPEAPKNGAKA